MSKILVDRVSPYTPGGKVVIDGGVFNGPVLDVSHPQFGTFVGDGNANDAACVQAACDLASSAGGATVWIPRTANGINIGTTINLTGAHSRVRIAGPGKLITKADTLMFLVNGASRILFDGIELDGLQTAGATNHLINMLAGSRISIIGCKLYNSRNTAIRFTNVSQLWLLYNDIDQSYAHGIFGNDLLGQIDEVWVVGNRIRKPGFNNAGGGADGKGIGFQSTTANTCTRLTISDNEVIDALHVSIELWSDDVATTHFCGYATIQGNRVRQSLTGPNSICISVAGSRDVTCVGNQTEGGGIGLEIAYSNRVTYVGNSVINCIGTAISVSRSTGGLNSVVKNGVVKGNTILNPTSQGIQLFGLGCKNFQISDNIVDGTGSAACRGIFVNNLGTASSAPAQTDAQVVVSNNIVTACGKTGIYVLSTQGVHVKNNISSGNNTSVSGGEDQIVFNFGAAAEQDTCKVSGNVGSVTRFVGISADALATDLLIQGGFKKVTCAVTNVGTNFAHGLGYIPNKILFSPPTANVVIWQSGAADATNVKLQGSAAGPTNVDVYVA